MEYIAFDAHKRYTLASVARPDGGLVREQRIPHERGALQQFLERCEHGSPVAVETILELRALADEDHARARKVTLVAQLAGRNPDRR